MTRRMTEYNECQFSFSFRAVERSSEPSGDSLQEGM